MGKVLVILTDQDFLNKKNSYYLLIESDILENIIDLISKCPTERCSWKVEYYNDFQNKQGLSCKFEFCRTDSSWSSICFTCKVVGKKHALLLGENGKAQSLFVVT